MARVALLIGTGEYSQGFQPLPAAPKDVMALEAVLRNLEMGGFDAVETLINPQHSEMAEKIETWFRRRMVDDLVLLYISGHGVKSVQRELFFAASNTRKEREELVTATAVQARFIHDCIRASKAKRQILILDCCFSGAFGDLLVRDDGAIDIATTCGSEGRVVLTSSSSTQYSFEQRNGNLSIYTSYLVEGIETGAADLNNDGLISVEELHRYASQRVQEASPNMNPKIIVLKDEGYDLRIAKAPLGDPKVRYRKEVGAIAEEDEGEISFINRENLNELQSQIGLTDEEVQQIEFDVLEPYRQRKNKTIRYYQIFTQEAQKAYPLNEKQHKALKRLQLTLNLRDEDIESIEKEILATNNFGESEEELLRKVKILRDEIEFISGKIEEAEQDYDLNLAAELKYGRLDKLMRELQELEGKITCEIPKKIIKKSRLQSKEIASGKGLDYDYLQEMLIAERWQEADLETYLLMMQALGKGEGEKFTSKELSAFPCQDLQRINKLWVEHSDGKFGFSVQNKIYLGCGGKPISRDVDKEVWKRFSERTGWYLSEKYEIVRYDDATFDTSAPVGHLPFGIFLWGLNLRAEVISVYIDLGGEFFSRIAACRL